MKQRHLILGGARSGKSRFAESVVNTHCQQYESQKIYLATATALDEEMKQRIIRHQQERGDNWLLIEEPINLAKVIAETNAKECILIECLTLWINNCLYHKNWEEQKSAFIHALKNTSGAVVMVSNELGQGIIPTNALSRQFIDESGWLHQELAVLCNKVSFVTAGIPQTLKNALPE